MIAGWLISQAKRGQLRDEGGAERFTRHLGFRYADYQVDLSPTGEFQDVALKYAHVWRDALKEPGKALHYMRVCAVLAWDSVLDLQRFVLALLGLSVALHEVHQLQLVALVMGSYLVAILIVRPWRSPTVWRLQVAASIVLVLTCFGIMACNVGDITSHYSQADADRLKHVVSWVVVGLNLAYVMLVGVVLMCCVKRDMRRCEQLCACCSKCKAWVSGCVQHQLGVAAIGPAQT